MNKLYTKGKGKIHPSPASPGIVGAGPADVMAVLRLLPAAIFALTAALGAEDREVLAYLMMRSIDGVKEERMRCRRPAAAATAGGGVPRVALDCGCFECYTAFWSRWDCSPHRELIHQAIEGFEEHLASKERGGGGGRGRRRRAEKKKGKERKFLEEAAADPVVEAEKAAVDVGVSEEVAERTDVDEAAAEEESNGSENIEEEEEMKAAGVGGGERRVRWPDVMGIFNSRLLNLWGPVL